VALHNVALYYEKGWIVAADRAEAVRWYKRAAAAGSSFAEDRLKALSACGARDTAALRSFPYFVQNWGRGGVWAGQFCYTQGSYSKEERCTAINFISFAELKEKHIINLSPIFLNFKSKVDLVM
jgi:TPR repeat protein